MPWELYETEENGHRLDPSTYPPLYWESKSEARSKEKSASKWGMEGISGRAYMYLGHQGSWWEDLYSMGECVHRCL